MSQPHRMIEKDETTKEEVTMGIATQIEPSRAVDKKLAKEYWGGEEAKMYDLNEINCIISLAIEGADPLIQDFSGQ